MHLRRALLLFAIVLGVAAIAASLAPPPPDDEPRRTTPTETAPQSGPPEAGERPAAEPVTLELNIAERDPSVSAKRGDHVILNVRSDEPGQVRLDDLGLVNEVAPGVPVTFDIFPAEQGRHALTFVPTGGEERAAGALVVAG
jgi:hypothetical protein